MLVVIFNFYGYRLFLSYLQFNQSASIEKKVDQQLYSDDELISIKTTLNLPYYSSSTAYERVYGSINIKGVDYEYVKRRVYQDTLELLCIPNYGKSKLQKVANELAKMSADGQASAPSEKSTIIKIGLPDYYYNLQIFSSAFLLTVETEYDSDKQTSINAGYHMLQEKPPQSMPA